MRDVGVDSRSPARIGGVVRTAFGILVISAAVAFSSPAWANESPLPSSGPDSAYEASPLHQLRSSSWSPASPPADLDGMIRRVSESVVTVYCGNTPATAWALSGIRLHPDAQRQGHRTMLVTSLSAMRGCLSSNTRYVEMRHRGIETLAYVWGWDEAHDVASIHTTLVIPGLQWSEVPRPTVNQWVAAVGSSNGVGVSTTIGSVTSVGLRDISTTISVGQQATGAPVLDNAGRVLATMSAESWDLLNQAVGNPLLCAEIINCTRPLDVWMNFTVPGSVGSLRASPLKGSLRVRWARPGTTSTLSPVDVYEYRIGSSLWRSTNRTSVVLTGLAKGRLVTVEVRAVNFMGPGPAARVSARPR